MQAISTSREFKRIMVGKRQAYEINQKSLGTTEFTDTDTVYVNGVPHVAGYLKLKKASEKK